MKRTKQPNQKNRDQNKKSSDTQTKSGKNTDYTVKFGYSDVTLSYFVGMCD